VVGCGYWGSKHVRVLSHLPEVGEIAVIDTDEGSRRRILSAFPRAQGFADIEAALPHLDALVIATPARTHAELALTALGQGKHVLVEKPLATSLADGQSLVEEARRTGAVLMVGHTFEFNPAVCELKRRIDLGELGKIYYIDSARLNLGLYRSDVNVVWDLAIHDVYLCNYLLGSVPTTVSAWGSANAGTGVEDLAYIRLAYEELGINAYLHVSWLDPKKVRKVTVVGSRKMAVYDDLEEERLRIFDRGVEHGDVTHATFERPLSYRYGDIISPHIRPEEPLAIEIQHFVESIRNGTSPRTNGRNGLAAVAVLEAVDASLATQTAQRVWWPSRPIIPAAVWEGQAVAGCGR
jgi:predicted dehydrogenase